ncbi:m-phase inducer phosphatase [Taxawa tesnikishii (nom. ined.)]|nr:m-phase inducer phosphatase [Dothideales sp. JES 119]
MLPNADEVQNHDQPIGIRPAEVSNDCYSNKLRHLENEYRSDSLPRILPETLLYVLDGRHKTDFENVIIVDCRFEYEHLGGHIEGAIRYDGKELLVEKLFEQAPLPRTLLVFYCEFSIYRAPQVAKHVRQHDRTVNYSQYPTLTYPEMYVLEGGYSKFFQLHTTRCYPQDYVRMKDQDHKQCRKRSLDKLRKRRKHTHAKAFACGELNSKLASDTAFDERLFSRDSSILKPLR